MHNKDENIIVIKSNNKLDKGYSNVKVKITFKLFEIQNIENWDIHILVTLFGMVYEM